MNNLYRLFLPGNEPAQTYTVKAGETCYDIYSLYSLTLLQFLVRNPVSRFDWTKLWNLNSLTMTQ